MADGNNGLEQVYEEVRAFVEARCGPGSLTRDKFNELCRIGAEQFEHRDAERQRLRDPAFDKVEALERRIELLEAEVRDLKLRVRRLEQRQ